MDDEPLIAGGQGRSDESVRGDGEVLGILIALGFVLALVFMCGCRRYAAYGF